MFLVLVVGGCVVSHCQSSKLLISFCVPGLVRIAAPLFRFREDRGDVVALVGYVVARCATGSATALDGELATPGVWAWICAEARVLGRVLPESPPTFDKLRHLLDRVGSDLDDVLVLMQQAFTAEAFDIARSVGLCLQEGVGDLRFPVRENTMSADGTWFKELSSVTVDPVTGDVRGSRSGGVKGTRAATTGGGGGVLQGPRVAEVLATTKGGKKLTGVPFVIASVRGEGPLKRVVLGISRFRSPELGDHRSEMFAAMKLLKRVIAAADGGIGWCVYDMALTGTHLDQLGRVGVVGIAAMKAAAKAEEHLELDPSGPGPTRYNNDERKQLARRCAVKTLRHRVNGVWCDHALSGVDGALRVHPVSEPVSLHDPLCELERLVFVPAGSKGLDLVATYRVPCPHTDSLFHDITLTGTVPGPSRKLMLNQIRPIHEYDEQFPKIKGWRQDSESVNSTMKSRSHLPGRATSLSNTKFELDLLGNALLLNAQCWDEYVSQISECAQRDAKSRASRARRVQATAD